MQVIYNKLTEIEKEKDIKIGLCAKQFKSDKNKINWHKNILFPSASIIKVLIAIIVLDKINKKQLALNTQLDIKKNDLIHGTSIIADLKIKNITIYNLLYYLLSHSDNTAQIILEKIIHKEDINNFFAKHKINDFVYVPFAEQTKKKKSLITPSAISQIFSLIEENKIINKKSSELIKTFLSKNRITYMGLRQLPIKINVLKPEITTYYSKSGINKNSFNESMMLKTKKNKIFNINLFITDMKINNFHNNVE